MADERVKQVKEANDIVEVIVGYTSRSARRATTYKGLCPFHDDHHPSFDVDPRRQRYRCWACDKYGDVITFVQEYEHVGFAEALNFWPAAPESRWKNLQVSPQHQGRAAMLDVVRWAAQQFHECLLDSPLAEEARRYLGERGLKGETVRSYGLGYAPRIGRLAGAEGGGRERSLELLEKVGLIAQREREAGLLRPLPRPRAVSDPRRARADGGLRRTDPAHVSPIVARAEIL